MAEIRISGSSTRFYTIEARQFAGYDDALPPLPGEALIIHDVDPAGASHAQVVDPDGNGDPNDSGAMWLPGEAFVDTENQISVTVMGEVSEGFVVTIENFPELKVLHLPLISVNP
jgi:hypothetical protein